MSTQQQTRTRPKDRKAQIAVAAAELFCERGYHGVGIDEIAEAVGISGPAVYRHFENKYAMLVHATRDLSAAVLSQTSSCDAADATTRLDQLLGALVRLGIERRRVGGLYQWQGRYLTPEHRAEFAADLSALVDRLAEPLGELRPTLSRAEARLLARGALSVTASLASHRAVIARSRAQRLLVDAAWALLSGSNSGARSARAGREPEGRRLPSSLARSSLDSSVQTTPARGANSGARSARAGRGEIILARALALFHQHGYHAVSMEEIGRAAGINASSVYRHFPGKADLLAAAYHRAADQVAATTAAALTAARDSGDALRRLVEAYVDFVFDQSELVSVYVAEYENLPAADRHELRKAQRLHVEEWVRLVGDLRPEFSPAEARVLAHAAINLINDLGRLARFDRGDGFDATVAGLALAVLRRDLG